MAPNSGNQLLQSASIQVNLGRALVLLHICQCFLLKSLYLFQFQTVVCFPFSGGVVEFGVTDLVTFQFLLLFSFEEICFQLT